MKDKVAVSVISVIVLVASFCLADAQQTTNAVPRIGFISSSTADPPMFDAFQQGLRDLGYVDGQNILIESRYGDGRLDRMPALVDELVQKKVDVIVATNNVVIQAAKKATKTIPIVMISSIDPVVAGYVESFAHPGGNITGLAWLLRDVSAKRIELLKELFPKVSRVGILWDADGPGPAVAVKEYESATRAFKLEFQSLGIRGPNPDFVGAFRTAKTARLDALIVVANPLMGQHTKKIFDLAVKYRLPSMVEERQYVNSGGLISYGANRTDLFRRAAGYVGEIVKGAKPGDLSVKVPERFEIFVNLKTARRIGVVIPQDVLVQADKVIQ